jgi:hypothetical protein
MNGDATAYVAIPPGTTAWVLVSGAGAFNSFNQNGPSITTDPSVIASLTPAAGKGADEYVITATVKDTTSTPAQGVSGVGVNFFALDPMNMAVIAPATVVTAMDGTAVAYLTAPGSTVVIASLAGNNTISKDLVIP